MCGEARGHTAGSRSSPNVAAIGEGNFVPMNVGKAKQLGLRNDQCRQAKTEQQKGARGLNSCNIHFQPHEKTRVQVDRNPDLEKKYHCCSECKRLRVYNESRERFPESFFRWLGTL